MRAFFDELRKRHVYRVAIGYAVAAWLLVQIAATVLPAYRAPEWILPVAITAIALGFPVALVLAWAFELTSSGLRSEPTGGSNARLRTSGAWLLAAIGFTLGAVTAGGYWLWTSHALTSARQDRESVSLRPEKSIAVLPFQNMSDDKQNAYFADGVQAEILTTLAKVADLKVISRTSVMQFRDMGTRNLRDIAQQLGVAHVLEGSVQRAANRVRVTAQLIDARTDAHLWADRYDRDLADVFAIQSEIAQTIAQQLQAALSPKEKAAMETKPTENLAAYDLYLRAKEFDQNFFTSETPARLEQLTRLLDEAVARDPAFVPALCLLARAHLAAFWFNVDPAPARLEQARKALDAAARIRPDDGELHMSLAYQHYWGAREYEPALAEAALARRSLPNDAGVLILIGAIERRQGRWSESTQHLTQAMALDPRNVRILSVLRTNYFWLRQYDDGVRVLAGILTWKPHDFPVANAIADADYFGKADLRAKERVLSGEAVKTAAPEALAIARIELALLQRNHAAASEALAAFSEAEFNLTGGYITPREWFEGLIALGAGDSQKARAAFEAARNRAAATLARRPGDSKLAIILAQIDARLGNRDDALREGERALELLPVTKDAVDGPVILTRFANIHAQLGDRSRALDLLEQATKIPNGEASYGELKLDERWDPLRNEPRFQTILTSVAPK